MMGGKNSLEGILAVHRQACQGGRIVDQQQERWIIRYGGA